MENPRYVFRMELIGMILICAQISYILRISKIGAETLLTCETHYRSKLL